MKKTTYFILGILGIVLIIAAASPFIFRALSDTIMPCSIDISGKKKFSDFSDIKTIRFSYLNKDSRVRLANCNATITRADSNVTLIEYPESEIFKIIKNNDTLDISLDMGKYDSMNVDSKIAKYRFTSHENINVNISLPKDVKYIENDCDFNITLNEIKTDSISIYSYRCSVLIDSCNIGSVNLSGDSPSILTKNSEIKNLYIDLDYIRNWTVENCKIENEILTGSGSHNNYLSKNECSNMIWIPKTKDASLKVTMAQRGNISLIKQE